MNRLISVNSIIKWLDYALEGLWLLVIFLIPLVFIDRDSFHGEAVISYIEVPKITLLRSLTGLMGILWLLKWAVYGFPLVTYLNRPKISLSELKVRSLGILAWLNDQPSRWIIGAAVLFMLTTLVSTVFSESLAVSLWGEVPGQDGYSAYTVFCYFFLFVVMIFNIKKWFQVARILIVLILVGVMVSGYGVLQHYHFDFFNLTEMSGGSSDRITSFMGNSIFAGAVILMTLLITLSCSFISLSQEHRRLPKVAILLAFWGMILGIQVIGLLFTLSRGPWVGTAFGFLVFFVLAIFLLGLRNLLRMGIVLISAALFGFGLLAWQGSIPLFESFRWIGPIAWLGGLVIVSIVFLTWHRLFWVYLSAMVIAFVTCVGTLAYPLVMDFQKEYKSVASITSESVTSQAIARVASIKNDVTSGAFAGRGTHWKYSWKLARERPWPEFDNLKFEWARPWIGYGPDLFRYAYLLVSPPKTWDKLPHEADHAHNFFIHQMVEQGFIGLASSLFIFISVFWAAWKWMKTSAKTASRAQKLILFGLVALVAGRSLEMMVGVARVSDLTILWAAMAVLVGVITLSGHKYVVIGLSNVRNPIRYGPKAGNDRSTMGSPHISWVFPLAKLTILMVSISGITIGTWLWNVNYAYAGTRVALAVDNYYAGELQSALHFLDKAIQLAPEVAIYHNYRATVYSEFLAKYGQLEELDCLSQQESDYRVCLAKSELSNNVSAVEKRPLYYKHRLVLADYLQLHGDYESAIELYLQSLSLVPNSWTIRNELAEAYLDAGRVPEAINVLNESFEIMGEMKYAKPYFLQGRAYFLTSKPMLSAISFEKSLELGLDSDLREQAYVALGSLYKSLGVTEGIQRYDKLVKELPPSRTLSGNTQAKLHMGIFLAESGMYQEAAGMFENLIVETDLLYRGGIWEAKGRLYESLGLTVKATNAYYRAISLNPKDGFLWADIGEAEIKLGNYEAADKALNKLSDLGLEHEAEYLRANLNNFSEDVDSLFWSNFDEVMSQISDAHREYNDRSGLGQTHVNLAWAEIQMYLGNHQEVRSVLRDANEEYESSGKALEERLDYLEELGLYHINEKALSYLVDNQIDKASEFLTWYLTIEPNLSPEVRGQAYELLAEINRSIEADKEIEGYTDVIERLSIAKGWEQSVISQLNRGRLLSHTGKHREAIDIYKGLLKDQGRNYHPYLKHILMAQGEAYQELGLMLPSYDNYDRSLKMWPDNYNGTLWLKLAESQFDLGLRDDALKSLGNAADLSPMLAVTKEILEERISGNSQAG